MIKTAYKIVWRFATYESYASLSYAFNKAWHEYAKDGQWHEAELPLFFYGTEDRARAARTVSAEEIWLVEIDSIVPIPEDGIIRPAYLTNADEIRRFWNGQKNWYPLPKTNAPFGTILARRYRHVKTILKATMVP